MAFFEEIATKAGIGAESFGAEFMQWGRSKFAASYASGGIASYMFSPAGQRPWGRTAQHSVEWQSRMLTIANEADPRTARKIRERAAKMPGATGTRGALGKMGAMAGPAMMAGFVAMPAFTTEGGFEEKSTAVGAGIAGFAGWEIGSKVGVSIGASGGAALGAKIAGTIGTTFGPIGTAIGAGVGALVGYIAGGFMGSEAGHRGVYGAKGWLDSIADKGKRMRTQQGWYRDTSAFDTRKALTMRQSSLQMMNQGLMSARSGMGHEGVMIHR